MLFRLFKPLPEARRGSYLAAVFLIAGCSGAKFVASDAAGGTSGSAAASGNADNAGSAGVGADDSAGEGGTSSGGVSGGGTSGGGGASAGTTSSAGTGGKPATGCDCAAGSYCQAGTKACRVCTNFSSLEFAAPEKLATLSQTGDQRFPRPGSTGSDLFYRLGKDGNSALYYAPTPISGIGQLIPASTGIDSGPLLAPNFSPQNFYFDRVDPTTKLRQIMYATWIAGKLSEPTAVPSVIPLNGGNDDFSVAVAANPRRAYWMSSRNKMPAPDLLWATFGAGATTPAVLDLKVKAGKTGTCPLKADKTSELPPDATPWVNADGTLLLFRSESVNDNCVANDSGAYDLFAAPLGPDGTPLAPAVPLSALNNTGGASTETDPALSADSCTIYFASDNGKGDFDLYSAARN